MHRYLYYLKRPNTFPVLWDALRTLVKNLNITCGYGIDVVNMKRILFYVDIYCNVYTHFNNAIKNKALLEFSYTNVIERLNGRLLLKWIVKNAKYAMLGVYRRALYIGKCFTKEPFYVLVSFAAHKLITTACKTFCTFVTTQFVKFLV